MLQDDMAAILEKMQEADVLVIATLTYFMTINGMLKTSFTDGIPLETGGVWYRQRIKKAQNERVWK